jgi:signal transduction histidine kinase
MLKSHAALSAAAAAPLKKPKPGAEISPAFLRRSLAEKTKKIVSLREHLRAERARLSLIVSSLVAGVVLTDSQGRLLLVNDGARRMLGLPGSGTVESLGRRKSFQPLLGKMRRPRQAGVRTGVLRLPSQEDAGVKMLLAPLRDAGGTFWGTLAILEEGAEEDERLSGMKSDFISRVSHELKTPLASIRAATDVIAQAKIGALNRKQEKMLRIITEETGHLVGLVEDLLDMSEIESGRLSMRFRRCSLAEGARSAMDQVRAGYRQKEVALLESLPASCPAVHADPERLRQVFDNLLSNALKFTPTGGRVELAVRVEGPGDRTGGRRVLLASVSDNGVGIPRKDLKRIFEKFHQGESLNTRSAGGTGLGLSISKFLVEAHGGEIWVESRPGSGSTFFFSIPIAR